MVQATPREAVLGSGAGGPLTAPTPWLSFPGYVAYLAGGVVVGAPSGGNQGPGTVNAINYYLNGVLVDPSRYVALTGGTMTGLLSLSGAPTNTLHAATKGYVDSSIVTVNATFANYIPLAGGTMTGLLTLSADPTVNLHAATKHYVDNKFTGLISIPDAPSDGTNYGRKNGAWVDTSIIDIGTF
jgi:hypothetical protein